MNIKSLVKIAKVVAGVAMVMGITGCVSIPAGTPYKGEALQVEPWEKARVIWAKRLERASVSKAYLDSIPANVSIMDFKTVDDVFGGGKWNHYLAIVPAGTDPMPKAGDFIEVRTGGWEAFSTFSRILPADCGWRGLGLVTRRNIVCDSDK